MYIGKRNKSDLIESIVDDAIIASARVHCNNTLVYQTESNCTGYQLHDTEIARIHPDGSIELNTGGYRTVTTKSRINEILSDHKFPFNIYSKNSVWYLSMYRNEGGYIEWDDRPKWAFDDGVTIHPDYTVSGALTASEIENRIKLGKRVNTYAKRYAQMMVDGKIPPPDGGDCWYCYMFPDNKDNSGHLVDHMEEKYYVPSLLVRAIEEYPVSMIVKGLIGNLWVNGVPMDGWGVDIAKDQIRSTIRRYMRGRLGLS